MQIQLYDALDKPTASASPRLDSFSALARLLQTYPHEGDKSDAPLWAPHEFYVGAPLTRKIENIARLHAVVLDFDDLSALDWERVVVPALRGREYLAHTSYSHWRASVEGRVRLRVVLSVSRPIEVAEWPEVLERVRRTLGVAFVKKPAGGLEKTSAALSYFVWSWPEEAQGSRWFDVQPGTTLDVDGLLSADRRALGRPRCTVTAMRALADKMARSRNETKKSLGEALGNLATGSPFAPEGDRDNACYMLAGVLAREFSGASEVEICEVFRRSINAMAGESGSLTHEQVADKVARQVADRASRDDGGDKIRERWRHCLARSGRDEAYDEAELEDLAERVGLDRAGLSSAWVMQHGPGYYLLGESRILGPYQSSEVPERAEIVLAPADTDGVECQVLRAGKPARKKPADLVAENGRVLDRVVYSLSRQYSVIEERSGGSTLYLASCPLRAIEPRRDAGVEGWLACLGGDSLEWLLDWIAVVTEVAEPCQALFLEGRPGAGKELLVSGLSRLWTEDGPTGIEDLMGDFNDPILECPLVFADEELPKDRGIPKLDQFKTQVTRRTRSVNQKFVKKARVEGAVRIVLAANNREMLFLGSDLTPDDVQALLDRLIHVQVGSAAVEYLAGLDSGTLDKWVEGDAIAAHALWLAETRTVKSGRLRVRPCPNLGLRSLSTDTGLRGALCHWLTLWITTKQVGTSGLIRCRDGAIWVSARGLHEAWKDHDVSVERKPRINRIADALRPLAVGKGQAEVSGSTVTFEIIDTRAIAEWADSKGFATAADIEKMIGERSG